MKNITVFILAFTLVCVLFYAGVNGILRGHQTGPLFVFLGVCSAIGLAIDTAKLLRERERRANARKFGRWLFGPSLVSLNKPPTLPRFFSQAMMHFGLRSAFELSVTLRKRHLFSLRRKYFSGWHHFLTDDYVFITGTFDEQIHKVGWHCCRSVYRCFVAAAVDQTDTQQKSWRPVTFFSAHFILRTRALDLVWISASGLAHHCHQYVFAYGQYSDDHFGTQI